MKERNKLRVIIKSNKRTFSDEIDLQEEKLHFNECVSNGANPHLEKITFEHYIRPIKGRLNDLDKYNQLNSEAHFIFGYFECLFQSDNCPQWISKDDEFEVANERA